MDLTKPNAFEIQREESFFLESDGMINAPRFITKNLLALVLEQSIATDWFIDYLVLPLAQPIEAGAGSVLKITFCYFAGGRYGQWEGT